VSWWEWVLVALFGALGAYARFFVDGLVSGRVGRHFPYGTLIVNLSGAFVLGVLAGAALSADAYRLAGTATIGAYTTFSTWMLETQRLAEDGRVRAAGANIVVSLALGLAVAAVGRLVGRAL
jgi:CrcB protein